MRGKNTETAAGPLPPAVLVVDDDMGVRLVQCRVLEDAGYQVIEAVNGEEGIKGERSRAALEPPAFVRSASPRRFSNSVACASPMSDTWTLFAPPRATSKQ